MFILEIIIFFLVTFFLITSISGLGKILSYRFESNIICNVFFGFIFLGIYSTFIHFFININFWNSILIFLIGEIIFISYLNKKKNIKFLNKKNIFIILIIFLLLPIFVSQKYHEDFGYYHLPYAISFIDQKIIFGFANINYAYIYNSIWLNISSLFLVSKNNFNFLTIHSFILYLCFVAYLLNNICKNKNFYPSNIFSILILFYLILKFTRISEYGVDLPAAIYSLLSILSFLKFFETNKKEIQKRNFHFFCNISFALFAILIKLSVLPIIILTTYLFFKFYFLKNFFYLKFNYLLIYLCFIFYYIQQFIYTGCIVFPSNYTCLDVSWFNQDFSNYGNKLEVINKSYSSSGTHLAPNEYIKNFNWFPYWIKRNYIEILEHVFTMIIPLFIYLPFHRKNTDTKLIYNKTNLLIIILFFLNLIFWLLFSPVYRFAIHLFVILNFLLILKFFQNRIFSIKVFLIFFCIIILFNFSKNINRIIGKERFFFGIEKVENKFVLLQDNLVYNLKVFTPDFEKNKINGWQGRLCWDIPFICSHNKLVIDKKNSYLILNKMND